MSSTYLATLALSFGIYILIGIHIYFGLTLCFFVVVVVFPGNGIEPSALSVLGKHSTWAISPALFTF